MRRSLAFSLAEVLLSLGFLALILVMAVGILHFSMQSGRRGEHALRASLLAQEKLAQAVLAVPAQVDAQGPFPAPWDGYAFQVTHATLGEGLMKVQVQVTGPAGARSLLWTHRRAQPREVLLCVNQNQHWHLARASEEGGPRSWLPATQGSDTQPTVSPDGSTVVFVSSQGGLALWWMPTDGSLPPARLEGAPAGASGPAFSPDGRSLAFTAVDQDGQTQVYTYDWSGHTSQALTHLQTQLSCPCWSPDASQLAVVLEGSTIALVPAQGGNPQPLVSGEGWNTAPAFSPDGHWLAFMSNRDGNPEIYRIRLGSTQVERLTQDTGYDTHPAWSPDGGRLAFQSNRGGQQRVWSMNADGTDVRRLGELGDEATPPDPLPEGEPTFFPEAR